MKLSITFALALVTVGTTTAADSPKQLAEKAQKILRANCYRCHGRDGTVEGGMSYVLDRDKLVERGKIIPGKPEESSLLQRMIKGKMPPKDETPRPAAGDLDIVRQWIAAGAPAAGTTLAAKDLVGEADLFTAMRDDLEGLPDRSRRFIRYVSLASVYNQGLSDDQLQAYRNAVSKLINSLSWHPKINVPRPIDAKKLVLRIDLRDYLWDAPLWNRMLKDYPYGVLHESSVARAVVVMAGTRVPCIRADWFLANACRPPLYYDFLQIPANSAELEQQLRVNVALNIIQERVARAGFNNSGISQNNRILERHDSLTGAYWRTYDFEAVQKNLTDRLNLLPDRRSVFAYPLGPGSTEDTFQHAGGEIIFHLPNGLLGFVLVDADNLRIDKGPTQIVSDPRRPDRAVEPGVSCMSCHRQGIIEKDDQLRDHVRKSIGTFDREVITKVSALHPSKTTMRKLMAADSAKFQKALEATGNKITPTEIVSNLTLRYEAPVDLSTLAAEVGMTRETFLEKVIGDPAVARHLDGLKSRGVTLSRETIEQAYPFIADTLQTGKPLEAGVVGEALPDNTGEKDPLEGDTLEANGMAFSADGTLALIASADKSVRIHDVEARRDLRRLIGHTGSVWSVAFSPDAKLAVSGSADRTVKIWDVRSGKELRTFKDHFGLATAVAFAPDGKHVLTAALDHTVIYRNWETATVIRRFDHVAKYVNAVAFAPDGKWAALCADNTVYLVSLKSGNETHVVRGHTDSVTCVAFSRDGKRLLTGSDDGTARLWDVKTGRALQVLRGHESYVKAVAISADETQLLTAGTDRSVRLWDAKTGKEQKQFNRHRESVLALAFVNDARATLSGSRDSDVREWILKKTGAGQGTTSREPITDPPPGAPEVTLRIRPKRVLAEGERIASMVLSPDRARLYYLDAAQPKLVYVDVAAWKESKPLALVPYTSTLVMTPNGKSLITLATKSQKNANGGVLQVIDADTWKIRKTIRLSDKPYNVTAADDGRIYVTTVGRGWSQVLVLDAGSGKTVARWGGVWSKSTIRLSSDQQRLYVSSRGVRPGSIDALIIPEDPKSKPKVHRSTDHDKQDVAGPFIASPDGAVLISHNGKVLQSSPNRGTDLRPFGEVAPFRAGVSVPELDQLLLLTEDGDLLQYRASSRKRLGTILLTGMGYRIACDPQRRLAYVAVLSLKNGDPSGVAQTAIHVLQLPGQGVTKKTK